MRCMFTGVAAGQTETKHRYKRNRGIENTLFSKIDSIHHSFYSWNVISSKRLERCFQCCFVRTFWLLAKQVNNSRARELQLPQDNWQNVWGHMFLLQHRSVGWFIMKLYCELRYYHSEYWFLKKPTVGYTFFKNPICGWSIKRIW